MVCCTRDYKTYGNAKVQMGNGMKGFKIGGNSLKGFGLKGFSYRGFDGNGNGIRTDASVPNAGAMPMEYEMVMSGDGLPRWLKKVKDGVVSFGRRSLPWLKKVGVKLASENADLLAGVAADEISRRGGNNAFADAASKMTRRAGSVAKSRAMKADKAQGKLSAAQNIAKDAVSSTSRDLLQQMIGNRKKAAESEGNGISGFSMENAQNILTK